MRVDGQNPVARWTWIASLWFAFALVDSLQTVFTMRAKGMHHAWVTLFLTGLAAWIPWAVATAMIFRLSRYFPPVEFRRLQTWIVHLSACCAIGLVFSGWTAWLEVVFDPYLSAQPPPYAALLTEKFYNGLISSLVLYVTIVAIGYALESRDRLAQQETEAARLNEELSKAQLDALRRQIEPHFLFNSLNAISGLVREGKNNAAVTMIAGLSDFLRRTLEGSAQQVSLRDEMEFTQRYLEIQKMRLAERLQLIVDVPAELCQAQVPSLILQPMVENAVKHGIAKLARGGTIKIAAVQKEGKLTLLVTNDGPKTFQSEMAVLEGVGIPNVRSRLQRLYGNSFEFELRSRETGGAEVFVSIPYSTAESAEAK